MKCATCQHWQRSKYSTPKRENSGVGTCASLMGHRVQLTSVDGWKLGVSHSMTTDHDFFCANFKHYRPEWDYE